MRNYPPNIYLTLKAYPITMNTHDIQSWLNGEKLMSKGLRKQYKLIALIIVMVFVYIYTGYQSMYQQHKLTDTKKEMLDAKFEYLTISAKWVNATRQSEIVKTLEERGSDLKENTTPPVRINN